ncbi:Uncharacterised protein [Vibrio cholerae]|nr:Uncharacterised protein [Vibrio cholerae]CSA49257.1 Uncharacterised protein [Vibrio cholerae]CSB36768.1 Uncharacterised protein [Vibrio cholerae]CSB37281.1 Uncharacterised protein [Vibrio cholerae]CSB42056.1 Uncharacterised protein [Vibrio cholerae]
MACSRTGHHHWCISGDPTITFTLTVYHPLTIFTYHFNNGDTDCRLRFTYVIRRHRFTLMIKQILVIGVFIVDREHTAIFADREKAHAIRIIAKLLLLCF